VAGLISPATLEQVRAASDIVDVIGAVLPLKRAGANFVALTVTTLLNTEANRRFTFGVTGSRNALRDQFGGAVAFVIGLALSSATLAAVHAASSHSSKEVELAALVLANALSTVARFVLLRAWVFHPRRHGGSAVDHEAGRPAAAQNSAKNTTKSAAQNVGEL